MTILLHKPYLVKVRGRGIKMPKNVTTWFIDDPQWDKKRHPMVVFTICLFFTPTQKKILFKRTKIYYMANPNL